MEPRLFIAALWGQGFSVDLGADDAIVVSPGSMLHETQRETLRAHKPEIVAYLRDNPPISEELYAAAMRACDQFNDGPAARAEMADDCRATPSHQRRDLLAHFEATYPPAINT